MSLNRYAYAGANPVNFVDPSGMIYETPYGFTGCSSPSQTSSCDCCQNFVDRWICENLDSLRCACLEEDTLLTDIIQQLSTCATETANALFTGPTGAKTRGLIFGGEIPAGPIPGIPTPLVDVLSVGGSIAFLLDDENNCDVYFTLEGGLTTPTTGVTYPYQLFFGVVWSTVDLEGIAGPSFNLSGDVSVTSIIRMLPGAENAMERIPSFNLREFAPELVSASDDSQSSNHKFDVGLSGGIGWNIPSCDATMYVSPLATPGLTISATFSYTWDSFGTDIDCVGVVRELMKFVE